MNIVSNCCLGGYAYKDIFNTHFANPFIWSWMTAEDVCYLIDNFNKIDFNDYELSTYNNLPLKDTVCFQITVENKIKIVFSHYQFVKSKKEIEIDKIRNMVYYNKMWEYVVKKYDDRLKRMSGEPVFLLIDDETEKKFSIQQIEHIIQNSKYKVLIFTQKEIKSKNPNVKIIWAKDLLPEHVSHTYSNEIKSFLT